MLWENLRKNITMILAKSWIMYNEFGKNIVVLFEKWIE